MASAVAQITDDTISRAESFQHLGLDGIDALHLALAEMSGAEVFLTTDGRLIEEVFRELENDRHQGRKSRILAYGGVLKSAESRAHF